MSGLVTTTLCVPVPAGVVAVDCGRVGHVHTGGGISPNFDGSPADEAGACDGYGSSPGQSTTAGGNWSGGRGRIRDREAIS